MSSLHSKLAMAAAASTDPVWMKVADSETESLAVRAGFALLALISEAAMGLGEKTGLSGCGEGLGESQLSGGVEQQR